MNLQQTMTALAAKGSETTKRLLAKHGAKEPFFGVKIGDLKPLHKQLKGRQDLALELYATGNADAQYLAGMIADGRQMSRDQVQAWADTASWDMISGTIVPWVASEHPEGFALARQWIASPNEQVARAGWKTLCAIVTIKPDDHLPITQLDRLLDRVVATMSVAPDGVRYVMIHYIIACGTYVAALADRAIAVARAIGPVDMDMGDTACQIPDAESTIGKLRRGAAVAPKRKTVRC